MSSRNKDPNLRHLTSKFTETLTETHIPLLRQSLSSAASDSALKAVVDSVLGHILRHYETLEIAANNTTIAPLLPTSWPNSLETPFLLLGDIHPRLFTDLLRSFLNRGNQDQVSVDLSLDDPDPHRKIASAWENSSDKLITTIEEVECRTRLMVSALLDRVRNVQRAHVARAISSHQEDQKKKPVPVDEAVMTVERKHLVPIFVDSNRLRRSAMKSLVEDMSVHQATLFLEALCQILVGFKDQVYKDEEQGKRDNTVLLTNFFYGVIGSPPLIILLGKVTKQEIEMTVCAFANVVFTAFLATFVSGMVLRRGVKRSIQDGLWGLVCFFLGGIAPLFGVFISNQNVRIPVTIFLTGILIAIVLRCDYKRRPDPKEKPKAWILGAVIVAGIAISVGFAHLYNHFSGV